MTPVAGVPVNLTSEGWDADENREIRSIAAELDRVVTPRRRVIEQPVIELALSDALRFSGGMQSTFRALIIRQLLDKFGFDEHRVFQWRLEHKLIHALLLNHYAPGCMPVTRGLQRFVSRLNTDPRSSIDDTYVIKEALGHSSGERGVMDRTNEALASLSAAGDVTIPARLWDEQWLMQRRISIEKEYRVHSIEEDVIPDLTFHRFGSGNIPGERDAPNEFVERILSKLPDAIVGGSLLAWDIALTPDAELVVIEVNFSGYHPVCGRGFQCSGYYQDVPWGASMIARLLRFVEDMDGVSIDVRIDVEEPSREKDFYAEVIRWCEMLRNGEYE